MMFMLSNIIIHFNCLLCSVGLLSNETLTVTFVLSFYFCINIGGRIRISTWLLICSLLLFISHPVRAHHHHLGEGEEDYQQDHHVTHTSTSSSRTARALFDRESTEILRRMSAIRMWLDRVAINHIQLSIR